MKAQQIFPSEYPIAGDINFPEPKFPVLHYKAAFNNPGAKNVKEHLQKNNWTNAWTDGIYDYHHYHSTTHEVLVIISGKSMVHFGGSEGILLKLEAGDVIVIPAGVAHKRVEASEDFLVVGAYPDGEEYDMKYGLLNEIQEAEENIQNASVPFTDPVYGKNGPLTTIWGKHNTPRGSNS